MFLALLGTLCLAVECSGVCCPHGFVPHRLYKNLCYKIPERKFSSASTAKLFCETWYTRVAMVYNQMTLDFVVDYMNSKPVSGDVLAVIENGAKLGISSYPRLIDIGSTSGSFSPPVSVLCEYLNTEYSTNVTLLEGENERSGRLEVYYNNKWRSVCTSSNISIEDIGGVCSLLGHRPGWMLSSNESFTSNVIELAEGIVCKDNTTVLDDCNFDADNVTCGVDQLVGLTCTGRPCPDGYIRHKYYKNTCYNINPVEVASNIEEANCYCERFNAKVALVYNMVQMEFIADYAESLPNPSNMLMVNVMGDDANRFPWFYQTNWIYVNAYLYKHGRDWTVTKNKVWNVGKKPFVCEYTEDIEFTSNMTLVDGPYDRKGRVEVFHNGRWASVCSFVAPNQTVVEGICRKLGYRPARLLTSGEFKIGNAEISDAKIECWKTSANKYECGLVNETTSCGHTEDIGLYCFELENDEEPKIYKKVDSPVYTTKTKFSFGDAGKTTGLVVSVIFLCITFAVLIMPRKIAKVKTFISTETQTHKKETFAGYSANDKKLQSFENKIEVLEVDQRMSDSTSVKCQRYHARDHLGQEFYDRIQRK